MRGKHRCYAGFVLRWMLHVRWALGQRLAATAFVKQGDAQDPLLLFRGRPGAVALVCCLCVGWSERALIQSVRVPPSLLFPPAAWLCDARPHTQPKVDTRLQPGTLRGCLGPLPRCSGHRLLLCRPCFCGGCEAGAKRSRSEPIDPAR